jgi:hypothetical protein
VDSQLGTAATEHDELDVWAFVSGVEIDLSPAGPRDVKSMLERLREALDAVYRYHCPDESRPEAPHVEMHLAPRRGHIGGRCRPARRRTSRAGPDSDDPEPGPSSGRLATSLLHNGHEPQTGARGFALFQRFRPLERPEKGRDDEKVHEDRIIAFLGRDDGSYVLITRYCYDCRDCPALKDAQVEGEPTSPPWSAGITSRSTRTIRRRIRQLFYLSRWRRR